MSTFPSLIFAVVTHTPIWVWAAFVLIAFMGWQRTRDRSVDFWRFLLFPAVMIVVAATGFAHAASGVALAAIPVGVAAGGVTGWLLEREGATRRLPGERLWLRGEWWSLVQVLAIFGFRYATIVASTVNPSLSADTIWQIATTLVSSLLSAMVL
jgi:hypothetical protein